jgi:hypothetical protein
MQPIRTMRLLLPLALCAAFMQPAGAVGPPEATAYQITVDHAGVTTSGGVLALQEHPLWSVTLPGPISYPLIAGNGVFVTVSNPPGGSYGSHLYALDSQTGATRWGPVDLHSTQYWAAATYDAGALFVINDAGALTRFDAASGTVGWSVTLGGSFSAPPTASNGVVYVTGSLGLSAVDETSGSVLWTKSIAGGGLSSPSIGPNGVFVAFPCGGPANLFAYAFDGTLQWDVLPGCSTDNGSTAVYAGGRLYVPSFPDLLIVDATNGTQLSGQPMPDVLTPAVTASTGYFLADNVLTATDLASGNPLWTFNAGQLDTNPIVIDQAVVVGSTSGTGILYGLNAQTGVLVWQVQAGPVLQPAQPSVLAAADGILVAPVTDTLLAYALFGPPAPTALAATGAAGAVSLSWTAPAGATGTYNVYQGTAAGQEGVAPVLTGVSGTTASVTGLATGPTYYFTVKSVTAAGISAASAEASAASHDPAPPGTVTGSAGTLSVSLSWPGTADAQSYNVYMSANNAAIDFSKDAADIGLASTHVTFTGLDPSVTYYFAVKSNAYGALSTPSNTVAVKPAAPPAPMNLTATAASGAVSLGWAAVAGAESYALFMATAAGAEPATPVQGNITGTSATVSGLTNGTTYYFEVRTNMGQFTGGPSAEVSATPQAPVTPPPAGGGGGGAWDAMSALVGLAALSAASRRRLARITAGR